MNARRFALDELWHPAAATALERALHPAGHGPNSSSLLRPQAAVVAVASSAERGFLFVVPKHLRAFRNYFFTGGAVKENGICSAAFCESAALRSASSPSPSPAVTPLPLGELPSKARLRGQAPFPRKKAPLPSRKTVLFSTFFCPDVENPVQF